MRQSAETYRRFGVQAKHPTESLEGPVNAEL
jgi:hypothetical protein